MLGLPFGHVLYIWTSPLFLLEVLTNRLIHIIRGSILGLYVWRYILRMDDLWHVIYDRFFRGLHLGDVIQWHWLIRFGQILFIMPFICASNSCITLDIDALLAFLVPGDILVAALSPKFCRGVNLPFPHDRRSLAPL